VRRLLAVAVLALSCASPTEPPGGPEDLVAPLIVGMSPDSGTTGSRVDVVEFQFDEIVNEVPQGAASLAQRVLISPRDGEPVVRWRRDRITVRPRNGWRENTTYVVTLLPGVADLSGNVRDSAAVVVFSTGDSIPATQVRGVVFDWMKALPAVRAYVEASPVGDSLLVFATESDSLGRFSLPFLTPGQYVVRSLLDGNKNRQRDARELWDSTTITLRDTVTHDFYAFAQDTLPPRMTTVTAPDSLTLRINFDKPLAPDFDVSTAITLLDTDSARVPVARVARWAIVEAERAARAKATADSVARARAAADTSAAGIAARARAREDSINRAETVRDSIARDTNPRVPPPRSARPALETEIVVLLSAPLTPLSRYFIRADVTAANGKTGVSERQYTRPRPAAPRTGRDSSTTAPPPDR
jgi:hypothetical protein